MAYRLEGSLMEYCTCYAMCPCWIGEDPDGGVCEVAVAEVDPISWTGLGRN